MNTTNQALQVKLLLDFTDEKGNRCQKEQTVKINPPKSQDCSMGIPFGDKK